VECRSLVNSCLQTPAVTAEVAAPFWVLRYLFLFWGRTRKAWIGRVTLVCCMWIFSLEDIALCFTMKAGFPTHLSAGWPRGAKLHRALGIHCLKTAAERVKRESPSCKFSTAQLSRKFRDIDNFQKRASASGRIKFVPGTLFLTRRR
jgi:hypothetical protein